MTKFLAILSISAACSFASSVTVGTASTENCIPFTCDVAGQTTVNYQQVYLAAAFPGPLTISNIEFPDTHSLAAGYAPSAVLTGNFLIELSYTTAGVSSLSTTFANNIGSNLTTVFNGSLTGDFNIASGLTIPFSSVFNYNPSLGNLLLTVVATNVTPALLGYLDEDTSGNYIGRVTDDLDDLEGGAVGLVTTFNAAPEPGVTALCAVGLLAVVTSVRRGRRF